MSQWQIGLSSGTNTAAINFCLISDATWHIKARGETPSFIIVNISNYHVKGDDG